MESVSCGTYLRYQAKGKYKNNGVRHFEIIPRVGDHVQVVDINGDALVCLVDHVVILGTEYQNDLNEDIHIDLHLTHIDDEVSYNKKRLDTSDY